MKAYIFLLFFVLPQLSKAQNGWELVKDQDGIAVYTRHADGDKYKEVKVSCIFNTSSAKLVNRLQNVNHHTEWVYSTKKSYLISRKNRDTLLYYSEVGLPWPLSNRDLVVQLTFYHDEASNVTRIKAQSIPDALPRKPGIVRVPYSLGLWNVTQLAPDKIKIEYTFSASPGGSLPSWLVNMTVAEGPYKSFRKLKELLESQ